MKVEAAYGGSTKLVNRLGDRFSYEFNYKVRAEQGGPLAAKLAQATREKARVQINQPIDYPTLSAVTVGTAVSGGLTVNMKGTGKLTAGQFINLTANGKLYLHMVTADANLTAAGVAVQIIPAVRTSISVGSAVEVNNPMIEGYLANNTPSWEVNDLPRVISLSFQIVEAE